MPIRNIIQTAQERTIVKHAPDVVVYLEGLPYLLNPYIQGPNGQSYTLISFNDYVTAFQTTYDTDNLIPSASISLTVPNHARYMFQAPGGNNIFESMMQVQVFAKGYYPSPRGNTVYRRVFKGLTSHISHTDNGVTLQIEIQCQGIMYFLERMQIDQSPSLITNAERPTTQYTSNQYNLNPYQQLADTLLRGITFEGFQLNTIATQGKVTTLPFGDAVQAGYINKWQAILVNLQKDVHIAGYTQGDQGLPTTNINTVTSKTDQPGREAPALKAQKNDLYGPTSPTNNVQNYYVNVIKGYMPDFGVTGSIQLINGRIISRLERIRQITQLIGFEGYQDINGEIVFKPPLYNLDVTNVGPKDPNSGSSTSASQPNKTPQSDQISQTKNPFVVNLDEIISESENEDEKAIVATRMSVQASWKKDFQALEGTNHLRAVVSHIDIPKLAKFGLREQPAVTIPWLDTSDKWALYSYAVSELVRKNRGYRMYTCTIPMRPELKLGFPMYLPHKDMYGYIKSVSISYTTGGQATMAITLDTLRKRPMFPAEHTLSGTTAQSTGMPQKTLIYQTQPNLVMKWTAPPASSSSSAAQGQNTNSSTTPGPGGTAAGTGDVTGTDGRNNLAGNPATQLQNAAKPVFSEELAVVANRRTQYGTSWGTKADTTSKAFRVQNDATDADDQKNGLSSGPFFSAANWSSNPTQQTDANGNPAMAPNGQPVMATGITMVYLQKILVSQPYTDEKGYELATPFPWGRWKDLRTAMKETREGAIVTQPNTNEQATINGVNAFLFAGVNTGASNLEPGAALQNALTQLQSTVSSDDSFELVYPGPNQAGQDEQILNTNQPDDGGFASDKYLVTNTELSLEQQVQTFLTGTPQPTPQTSADLKLVTANQNVGVTVSATPPSQSILDKLVLGSGNGVI